MSPASYHDPALLLHNPLHGNPLCSWEDVARAARDLFEPLVRHFSPGAARVVLGSNGVLFGAECEALEGFARPLFGIVPLIMGGGRFDHVELYQHGLVSGTDPNHPEFWGYAGTDQRMVEMAAISFALAFLPDHFWQPLPKKAQENLAIWLGRINEHGLPDCNWHFFRVLVNLALETIGAPCNAEALEESLTVLESHYQAEGVYRDGTPGRIDYYLPWAYHTYGLLYSSAEHAKTEIASRFRERARLFSPRFLHWFDSEGRGIPFGRSLVYRFAQAAFWGALVFANEQALPWPKIKGIYLRQLRHWSSVPIAERDQILSLGYEYRNERICEPYSSACSPYWSMKAFLALAAGAHHDFWQAEEESAKAFENGIPRSYTDTQANFVFQRDESQVIMLNSGQEDSKWPDTPAKYGKFAYSSVFAFSISPREVNPEHGAHDSMLALRETGGQWRVRESSQLLAFSDDGISTRWQPWPDVEVTTILIPATMPWHYRVHRVRTQRPLSTAEQGFALGLMPSHDREWGEIVPKHERGIALFNPIGTSTIVAPRDAIPEQVGRAVSRESSIGYPPPATNLRFQRTLLPSLRAELQPGEHWLVCAVAATQSCHTAVEAERLLRSRPRLPQPHRIAALLGVG